MGEDIYTVNNIDIMFSEMDEEYRCLCTAFSAGIDAEIVRSLALLGSATVLACREDEEDSWFLPHCIPQEIRDGIDEAIYTPFDVLEHIANEVKKFYTPYSLDADRKQHILKMIEKLMEGRDERDSL